MIRVDHAGEYGAARIYQGQLAVLGRGRQGDTLRHMLAQEEVHRETFAALMADRRVRPTALLPLWHVAGFALGAATALIGERGAMACTVAVEEAIDEHYAEQAAAWRMTRPGCARRSRRSARRSWSTATSAWRTRPNWPRPTR